MTQNNGTATETRPDWRQPSDWKKPANQRQASPEIIAVTSAQQALDSYNDKAISSFLGNRLKEARLAAGLSQAALAKKIGLTCPSSINQLEVGRPSSGGSRRQNPAFKSILKICVALNLPLSYFDPFHVAQGTVTKKPKNQDFTSKLLSPEERSIRCSQASKARWAKPGAKERFVAKLKANAAKKKAQ